VLALGAGIINNARRGITRRSVQLAVLVEVPLLALGFLVVWATRGTSNQDFAVFRTAGRAVLHGHSPYSRPDPALLAQSDKFVYPAIDAFAFAPLALVPRGVAGALFFVVSALAVAVGLRLLGCYDWRCLSVALLSPPLFFALGLGALGPILFLGAALVWRSRNRMAWTALAVGLTVLAKLFLWPLIVWLVATRRWRAAAGALGVAALFALVGWAAIGFAGFRDYPTTVRVLDEVQRWKSYSIVGLALSLHLPAGAGNALLIGAGVAGCALTVGLARRPDGDRLAFSAAIVTALLATPLLWNHYLVLLLAPLALARPRLSWPWALPALLWLTPHPEAAGVAWRSALLLAVTATAGAVTLGKFWADGAERLRYRLSAQ
jgi:alpha-1,2-mannosyltransferase